MVSLALSLLPVALGIIMSPLAVIAVVAVLFSQRARVNSMAYLVGWVAGIVVSIGAAYAVLVALDVHDRLDPPLWLSILHLMLAAVLLVGAWYVYTRERKRLQALASARNPGEIMDAAPQLPSILQSIEHFTPARSTLLGFALFVLNPIDVSCAIVAALTLRLSDTSMADQLGAAIVFVLFASSSIAVPVGMLLVLRDRAEPPLRSLRRFIAGNSKLLNVGLLVLIAVMQINKGLQGL
ncbi:GAP family protein [Nocardia mangyaensis]|uniref:GAP family protein n=1 Tax=Nocardia mangyaensis TaxID=2213200 RepID=UPI0026770759|nr:GAP family protein [Nocardia mangyaensis]MDO3650428.1 GAP family protein [Nocardia mangyaensis]